MTTSLTDEPVLVAGAHEHRLPDGELFWHTHQPLGEGHEHDSEPGQYPVVGGFTAEHTTITARVGKLPGKAA